MTSRPCRECGSPLPETVRATAVFCPDTPCRRDYNNRRQQRGAELYDIFMELRFNRAEAEDKKLWGLMASLASAYRDADKTKRDGRLSWSPDAHLKIPLTFSTNGDNR